MKHIDNCIALKCEKMAECDEIFCAQVRAYLHAEKDAAKLEASQGADMMFWHRIGAVLLLVYSLTLVVLFIGIGLYGQVTVFEHCRWWWAVELFIFACSAALALWLLLRKEWR